MLYWFYAYELSSGLEPKLDSVFFTIPEPHALISGGRHVSLHILSNFWHQAFLCFPCVSVMGSKAFPAFSSETIVY